MAKCLVNDWEARVLALASVLASSRLLAVPALSVRCINKIVETTSRLWGGERELAMNRHPIQGNTLENWVGSASILNQSQSVVKQNQSNYFWHLVENHSITLDDLLYVFAATCAFCYKSDYQSKFRLFIYLCFLSLFSIQNYQRQDQYFSVDLDSVYHNPLTGSPVYKLSTVDSDRRNRFWLVAYVVYANGRKSQPFYSEPFLLKSKRSCKVSPY